MPALEALLTMFITCQGAASVSMSTMHHWLLGLELWHEINGAPWHGHSILEWAMKVISHQPHCLTSCQLKILMQAAGNIAPKPSQQAHEPVIIHHLECLH